MTSPAFSTTRFRALAKAERLQFTRSKTLLAMTVFFTLALPTLIWITRDQSIGSTDEAAEVFLLFALGLVVFYSSLTAVVTRRDEKVLKRLRTGEARDAEILGAVLAPIAELTLFLTLIVVTGFSTMSMFMPLDPPVPHVWPVNPVLMLVTVVLSIAMVHGLALLISRVTPNAENVQITAIPVLILLGLSQNGLRSALPRPFGQVLDFTPFALASDLFRYGWVGAPDFIGAFTDMLPQLAALTGWTALLLWAGQRYIRWETYR